MTAGSKISWCARCCHAIVPVEGGWGHFSDDDWAGRSSECSCTLALVPCRPPQRVQPGYPWWNGKSLHRLARMSITVGFDVTGANYASAPKGFQLAGYDTGSDGVAWTAAMWRAHPGAVHIDQAPDTAVLQALLDAEYDSSDTFPAGHVTSDVLDCEYGAVPVGSPLTGAWAKSALASYSAGVRPGQRRPVLYQSAANVTANVNALVAGGVVTGVGLWIANWNLTEAAAFAELAAASGPFAVTGVQFADDGPFDADLFSTGWLAAVSVKPE